MTAQSPKPSAHDVMAGRWTPTAQDTADGRAPGFGEYRALTACQVLRPI